MPMGHARHCVWLVKITHTRSQDLGSPARAGATCRDVVSSTYHTYTCPYDLICIMRRPWHRVPRHGVSPRSAMIPTTWRPSPRYLLGRRQRRCLHPRHRRMHHDHELQAQHGPARPLLSEGGAVCTGRECVLSLSRCVRDLKTHTYTLFPCILGHPPPWSDDPHGTHSCRLSARPGLAASVHANWRRGDGTGGGGAE